MTNSTQQQTDLIKDFLLKQNFLLNPTFEYTRFAWYPIRCQKRWAWLETVHVIEKYPSYTIKVDYNIFRVPNYMFYRLKFKEMMFNMWQKAKSRLSKFRKPRTYYTKNEWLLRKLKS